MTRLRLLTRCNRPLLATLLAALPSVAVAQALVPEDHPGFILAEAIAAQGCVLHQDDVNPLLEAAGLESQQFPMMALPLMQDGYLAPGEEGTLVLSNWGVCVADATELDTVEVEVDAQPDEEATEPASE